METRQTQILLLLVWLACAAGFFSLGVFIDTSPVQLLSFLLLIAAAFAMLLTSLSTSVIILFYYVGIEGFLKIISDYNPVIHVGADILVGMMVLRVLLAVYFGSLRTERQFPPLSLLIVLHIAWFLISFLNPFSLSLFSSVAGIKVYVSMLLLYFFGYYLATNPKKIRSFLVPWFVVACVQAWLSVYQSMIGPSSVLSIHPRYAMLLAKYQGFAFRPFGLTNLPGGPATFLYIAVPTGLYFLFSSRSWFIRAFVALQIPVFISALLVCQIRAAVVKAIIAGVVVLVPFAFASLRQSPVLFIRNIAIAAGAVVIVLHLLPSLTDSLVQSNAENQRALARTETVFDLDVATSARQGAFERFSKYAALVPLGAGLSRTGAAGGKFKDLLDKDDFFPQGFFSDNLLVALVVDLGLPGVLIFSLLIAGILGKGLQSLWRIRNLETFNVQLVLFAGLAAITFGAYGAEAIIYNPEAAFYWFFSGAMVRTAHQASVQS